jgi:hypothetical protein
MSSMTPASESSYLLPQAGEAERNRLDVQHGMITEAFGWLLAPEIVASLGPGDEVLDVGTGTGNVNGSSTSHRNFLRT